VPHVKPNPTGPYPTGVARPTAGADEIARDRRAPAAGQPADGSDRLVVVGVMLLPVVALAAAVLLGTAMRPFAMQTNATLYGPSGAAGTHALSVPSAFRRSQFQVSGATPTLAASARSTPEMRSEAARRHIHQRALRMSRAPHIATPPVVLRGQAGLSASTPRSIARPVQLPTPVPTGQTVARQPAFKWHVTLAQSLSRSHRPRQSAAPTFASAGIIATANRRSKLQGVPPIKAAQSDRVSVAWAITPAMPARPTASRRAIELAIAASRSRGRAFRWASTAPWPARPIRVQGAVPQIPIAVQRMLTGRPRLKAANRRIAAQLPKPRPHTGILQRRARVVIASGLARPQTVTALARPAALTVPLVPIGPAAQIGPPAQDALQGRSAAFAAPPAIVEAQPVLADVWSDVLADAFGDPFLFQPPLPDMANVSVSRFASCVKPARTTDWRKSLPEVPPRRNLSGAEFGEALARAALNQSRDLVVYSARYQQIPYPMGDIPPGLGSCSDVVIRAYRALGFDLQRAVHQSRIGSRDANIAHRRTRTLRKYFASQGAARPVTPYPADYKPGDIVTYYRPFSSVSRAHIAIVSHILAPTGRPMIIHNRGYGVQLEDALFVDRITGHYRFRPFTAASSSPDPS